MSENNRNPKLDEAVKEALDEAEEALEETEDKAAVPEEETKEEQDNSENSIDDENNIEKKEKSGEISEHEKKVSDSSSDDKREAVDDSEIVDINEASKDSDDKASVELPPVKKKRDGKKQLSRKQKKRIRTIIILLVIAGLIVAGVFYVRNRMREGLETLRQQLTSNLTPAQVERRDLTENISVTGKIRSNETRTQITNLVTQSAQSAKILTVDVEVGDYVNEGDVLVTFSTENIEKDIARTQEDLARQKKLDNLDSENNQRTYVYSYQQAADSLQDNAKTTDRALQSLYEACDAYGDSKRSLQEAKDKKSEAERNLQEARGANNAEKIMKYEQEVAQYEAKIPQLESAVAAAKSAEERAQQTYDDAVAREASGSGISGVQNNLSSADYNYQRNLIQSGERAQTYSRTLQDSKDKLDDYVVTASMSGLVTSVKVAEGNSFSSGEVLTIQDVSKLKVDAEIDEYDIWKVKEGMRVIVKTDATGDDEFDGVVSLVHPTATTSASGSMGSTSSTPTYTVTVDLLEKDERMMLGMNAKLSIIVNQAANVLCVPYDAIGQNADGEPVVYVLDDMSLLKKQKDKESGKDGKTGSVGVFRADGEAFGIINPAISGGEGGGRKGRGDNKKKKAGSSGSSSDILVENGISDTETTVSADGDTKESMSEEDMYHELVVKTGMETDYYTEIITDKLKEGDYIVIKNEDGGNDLFQMMMGGMPPG